MLYQLLHHCAQEWSQASLSSSKHCMMLFQLHLSNFVSACLEDLGFDLQKHCTITVANRIWASKMQNIAPYSTMLNCCELQLPKTSRFFTLTYLPLRLPIWNEGNKPSPFRDTMKINALIFVKHLDTSKGRSIRSPMRTLIISFWEQGGR